MKFKLGEKGWQHMSRVRITENVNRMNEFWGDGESNFGDGVPE